MDFSKVKQFVNKVDVIRDYSALLLPLGIVLFAVLVFVPGQLISGALKKRMAQESISKRASKVAALSKDSISSDQWKVEQVYQSAYENDANKIAILVRQTAQRELLSYKIFPEPKDTSTLIFEGFGRQYRSGIEQMLERINALDCPTQVELEKLVEKSSSPVFGGASASNSALKGWGSAVVSDAIKEELSRAKAESASVYANSSYLSGYDYWQKYEYAGLSESVKDCWHWQLGYWVIEDVIDTIAACNAGSPSVYSSRVKRLIGVSFTGTGLESGFLQDGPSYIRAPGKGLTNSYTGRISNDEIDVLHFRLAVLVGAKHILPFMQQLCSAKEHKFMGWSGLERQQIFKHNQITILESRISSIERDDVAHDLYRYGDDAVVRLDLACEYIFNRAGYEQVEPELVKQKPSQIR